MDFDIFFTCGIKYAHCAICAFGQYAGFSQIRSQLSLLALLQVSLYSTTSFEHTMELDIRKLVDVISNSYLFPKEPTNRGLVNFVTGALVEPEITHDLLHARTMGEKDFEIAVQYYFFKNPSIKFPKRKRKLLTFSTTQKKKCRQSPAKQEQKTITMCTKRTIAWANQHQTATECVGVQFIEQPRALVDVNNKPTKGRKSFITQNLAARYTTIINNSLPDQWTTELVVLDGMFLIHVKPFGRNTNFAEYVRLLLRRFVQLHFKQGTREVHVLFDKPPQSNFNPKQWEQEKRDDGQKQTTSVHVHDIRDTTQVPSNWKEFIACRQCKQSLTLYLALKMLVFSPSVMNHSDQKLITAGPTEPMSCTMMGAISSEDQYKTDALEADSRIWRHCQRSHLNKHYIFSPDTDTYIIGLTNHKQGAETFIDLTPVGSEDTKIMNLNMLIKSMKSDPDLELIEQDSIPTVLQSLYASTGCDYNPFFSGIGKGSFLKAFYTHAEFICSNGSLSDIDPNNKEGYLSFLRLVGTAYFLKYRGTYQGTKSPVYLFHSCKSTSSLEQHITWLNKIREHVWVHTYEEKNLLPSHTALKFQWSRALWVVHMWAQAGSQHTELLPPTQHGWKKSDDTYTFHWDSDETITAIRKRVDKLTKGCGCKKNMCMTKQCGCKQKGLTCGPGCQCMNCGNIHPQAPLPETPQHTLYFQNEMEQSLLIGEEVELRNDSDSSDTDVDTDTDTVSSTDSDTANDICNTTDI